MSVFAELLGFLLPILRQLVSLTKSGVRVCGRVLFPDDISDTVSRTAFILHTHTLRGWRCTFWGL